MQTIKQQRKKKRMSKLSKQLTSTKRVSKLSLMILLVLAAPLQACQTQSKPVMTELSPTLIFNEPHSDSQETYSSRAQSNIASWQQQLTDLTTAYEQQLKQIGDNQTTLP